MSFRFLDLDTTKLIELYEQGYSCNQIAKIFGCSERPIYTRLKEAGTTFRNQKENQKARFKMNPPVTPTVELICPYCNKPFIVEKSRAKRRKFCSIKCSNLWRRDNGLLQQPGPKVTLFCQECGQEFEVRPYLANKQKFCSVECAKYHKHVQGHRYANTNIERNIQAMLIGMGINFETHWRLDPFSADIYLTDYHKAIECDGDYWHSLPLTKQTDTRKSIAFSKARIPVLHLTESEIIKEQKLCYQKILAFIKEH